MTDRRGAGLCDFDRAFLYGDGRSHYQSLLPTTSVARKVPETMTRQRRRAAVRSFKKSSGNPSAARKVRGETAKKKGQPEGQP